MTARLPGDIMINGGPCYHDLWLDDVAEVLAPYRAGKIEAPNA